MTLFRSDAVFVFVMASRALPARGAHPMMDAMTKKHTITGKAAAAGAAIGSAAIAAALLYASKKRDEKRKNPATPHIDPPETD